MSWLYDHENRAYEPGARDSNRISDTDEFLIFSHLECLLSKPETAMRLRSQFFRSKVTKLFFFHQCIPSLSWWAWNLNNLIVFNSSCIFKTCLDLAHLLRAMIRSGGNLTMSVFLVAAPVFLQLSHLNSPILSSLR